MALVQCGWCPTIMDDDVSIWHIHFHNVHAFDGGYSVRPIQGTDWDIRELVPTWRAR